MSIKVLYVYGHSLFKKKGDYFHPYLNNILKRYSFFSSDITALISDKDLVNFNDYSVDNQVRDYKVEFFRRMNGVGDLFKFDNKIIEEQVKSSDFIITKLPSFEGFFAVKYAKKHNKKVLVELVGCPWDTLWNHSLKGKLLAPYMFFKTKKFTKQADFVLYVTNEFLQRRYPTSRTSIGCSDVVIQNVPLNEIISKYSNFKGKNTIILGTSGAIDVKYKGQDSVVEILKILNNNQTGLTFEYHLAGDGDPSYLLNVARDNNVVDNVKFLGLLDGAGVNRFLDTVDIYIQPSKSEGLSRALIEAMSRGCVCVASNVGGNSELIEDDYLYSIDKPSRIVEIIKKILLEDPRENSLRNFKFSRQFEKGALDAKRESFYKKIESSLK